MTLSTRSSPTLLVELCRVLDSGEGAILSASRHGQLTIDGWIIRPHHLNRWTPAQLQGRYAQIHGRRAQLYGPTIVRR
jgi:hypothetical protein